MIRRIKELFGRDKPSPLRPIDDVDLEIFRLKAQYEVLCLKDFLGDEGFDSLRTLDMKIPSAGEIILSESHGLRLQTIASNLKQFVARLDQEIIFSIDITQNDHLRQLWLMMRGFDDLADFGSRQDENIEAQAIVTNLLEFSLALINEMRKQLEPETTDKLVKRFSGREALRGVNLRPYVQVPTLH